MMNWLSSRERLGRCGRTRVDLNGRTPPRRCSRRRKVDKRAPLYAMSVRSQNVQRDITGKVEQAKSPRV